MQDLIQQIQEQPLVQGYNQVQKIFQQQQKYQIIMQMVQEEIFLLVQIMEDLQKKIDMDPLVLDQLFLIIQNPVK